MSLCFLQDTFSDSDRTAPSTYLLLVTLGLALNSVRGCKNSLKIDKFRPLQTGKEVIIYSTRNLGQDTEHDL